MELQNNKRPSSVFPQRTRPIYIQFPLWTLFYHTLWFLHQRGFVL